MSKNSIGVPEVTTDGAYLVSPLNGEVHVEPHSPIRVLFRLNGGSPSIDNTNISVNGKPAVTGGRANRGWSITDSFCTKDFVYIEVKCVRNLPASLVFVQASLGEMRTKNQQFYVKGARVSGTPYDDKPEIYDRCIYNDRAKVILRDRVAYDYISSFNSDKDGNILAVTLLPETTVINSSIYGEHELDFPCIDAYVSKTMLNLRVNHSTSAHLPISYRPALHHKKLTDLFTFIKPSEFGWTMIFGEDKHVWWNKNEILIRHDVNPICGYSFDMLWTKNDISVEEIYSIDNFDGDFVLVNGKILINTRNPRIYNDYR